MASGGPAPLEGIADAGQQPDGQTGAADTGAAMNLDHMSSGILSDLSQAEALEAELFRNSSLGGMSVDTPGASELASTADALVDLSVQGTKALHKLVHTSSAIMAVRSGAPATTAPETATPSEGIAERFSRLCDEYLLQSKELKAIVLECAQKGEALESSTGTAGGATTEPEDPELVVLQERASVLRKQAREKNLIVKQLMDQMTKLLDDMTMWECCARDASKPPAPA